MVKKNITHIGWTNIIFVQIFLINSFKVYCFVILFIDLPDSFYKVTPFQDLKISNNSFQSLIRGREKTFNNILKCFASLFVLVLYIAHWSRGEQQVRLCQKIWADHLIKIWEKKFGIFTNFGLMHDLKG